jgi:MFS family permease
MLCIMAGINFINYVDRNIISPLLPFLELPVKQGGLGLSPRQSGLLGTAFMIVHSAASIPLGLLADRVLRKRIIAAGVAIWSVATAAAGLARSFVQIFAARSTVGIGEAAYAPAATAIISERFASEHRSRALGVFNLGMFIGGAVGLSLGAVVAKHWGWRTAFMLVGLPGLALAGLVLLVSEKRREPGTVTEEIDPNISHSASFKDMRVLMRSRRFQFINLAGILITFFIGGLQYYAPTYLKDVHHLDPAKAGLTFGIIAAIAGVAGVATGSILADRLTRRGWGTSGRLIVIGSGVLAGAPAVAVGLLVRSPWVLYPCLGLGVYFMTWYIGPILAALHDVVPAQRRAAATGAYFFLIHLLGDALSPYLIGEIRAETGSLKPGMLGAVAVGALGGAVALAAAWQVAKRKLSDPRMSP